MNVWLNNEERNPLFLQCSSCSCLCKLKRRLFIAYSFNFKIAGITIPFSKTDIFRTSPDCPSQKELTVFYIGYANILMFNIYNILIHAYKIIYYSFKIFLRFWLTKITRIIYHNQLLLTKFGKLFAILNRWRQKCGENAGYWTVKREDLGTNLSCFRSE